MGTVYFYKNKLWRTDNSLYFTTPGCHEFTLIPGKYLLVCHGAKGGKSGYGRIAYGGQAYGVLNVTENETLYAFVGGDGTFSEYDKTVQTGGFNGGGNGAVTATKNGRAPGGGGASDIRILPENNDIPVGYYTTDWVQGDGYSYIKTEIPATGNIRFDVHFTTALYSRTSTIFGSSASSSTSSTIKVYSLIRYKYNSSLNGYFAYYQRESDSSGYHNLGMSQSECEYHISFRGTTLTVENLTDETTTTETITPVDFSTNNKIGIFGQLVSSTSVSGREPGIKLHNLKIYNNDPDTNEETLIADFVPCLNDSMVPGLYNKIDGVFYKNAYTSSAHPLLYDEDSVHRVEPDINSLSSRIIVAGGGGGSSVFHNFLGGTGYREIGVEHGIDPDADPELIGRKYVIVNARWTTGDGGGTYGGICDKGLPWIDRWFATDRTGYSFGSGESPTKVTSDGYCGGGGGWFGGWSADESDVEIPIEYVPDDITIVNEPDRNTNGGGGSGYVYTSTSYRPDCLTVEVPEKYQLTDTLLLGSPVEQAAVIILKETNQILVDDKIVFPCVGETQQLQLPPGSYILRCRGGSCNLYSGGYSEGILTIDDPTNIFVNVGGIGGDQTSIGEQHTDYKKSYANDLDNENAIEWGSINNPTMGFNGSGSLAYGNAYMMRYAGGATDIRINENNVYSRIMVAGGASTDLNGGGLFKDSPEAESAGAFGRGKHATSIAYPMYDEYTIPDPDDPEKTITIEVYIEDVLAFTDPGAGGWFGGGYDQSSGSGYVYTNDSYLISGYKPSSKYKLSSAVTTSGTFVDVDGFAKAEIQVLTIEPTTKMLCQDSQGFKYYDKDIQQWVLLGEEIPTEEDFDNYGISVITSDQGLDNTYSVIVYDEDDLLNYGKFYVIPNTQIITKTIASPMAITSYDMDYEVDQNINLELDVSRHSTGEDATIDVTLTADMLSESNSSEKVFSISIFSDKRSIGGNQTIPRKEPSGLPVSLIPIGSNNDWPMRYKNYLCGTFSDDSLVSPIKNAICYEHNREIYTCVQVIRSGVNRVRIVKLNLVANVSSIVIDFDITSLPDYISSNTYISSMLVNDTHIYLSFYQGRGLYRINLENINDIMYFSYYTIQSHTTSTINVQDIIAPMKWLDERTIIMCSSKRYIFFDIIRKQYDYYENSALTNNVGKSFDVGNVLLVKAYTVSSKTHIIAYNPTTDTVTDDIILPNSSEAYLCYGDGKFYVTQSSILNIYTETDTGLVLEKSVITPYTTNIPSVYANLKLPKEPRTINYGNGLLYITMKNHITMYIYDTTTDQFVSFGMRYTVPSTMSNQSIFLPTTFKKYFFAPFDQLLMLAKSKIYKYDMGPKYKQQILLCNSANVSGFNYDDRFVTFNQSHMSIHCGNIIKPLQQLSGKIKKAEINKNEYKSIINILVKERS